MREIEAIALTMVTMLCLAVKCDDAPADYGGKIVDVKWGSDWDKDNCCLLGIGTVFPCGVERVYYEVTLQSDAGMSLIVQKAWKHQGAPLLTTVCHVPAGTKRICGELHYYDLTTMDVGAYELSVFRLEQGLYTEYEYAEGINRVFTIE